MFLNNYIHRNNMKTRNLQQKRAALFVLLLTLIGMTNAFAQQFTDYKLSVFHEGIAAYENADGKWGYIDRSGDRIIPCIYNEARRFSEGLAAVRKGVYWGYINKNGETVIPFRYLNPYPFHEGYARVYTEEGKKDVIIDNKGNVVPNMPNTYYGFLPFSEGWAVVKPDQYTCYYIDKQGKQVTREFSDAMPFSDGLAAVRSRQKGLWGYIDKTGELVIPYQYTTARPFREGLAAVDGGYIDKSGNWVIPPKYKETSSFENGYALVKKSRTTVCVINKSGKELYYFTNEYDNFTDIVGFSNGIAMACNDLFGGKSWLSFNTKCKKLTNDTWMLSHMDKKYDYDNYLLEFNDLANECLFRADEEDDLALCYWRPKWNEITYYYLDRHGNHLGTVGSNLNRAQYITIESKECEITIDGKAVGRNKWTGELKKGEHTIRVTKACYEPYEETITIDGEKTTFKLTPSRLKKHSLKVSCNVDNCNVEIDGQIKTIDADKPLSLNLEMERIHTLSLKAPNHVPITVSFSILEDQIVCQDSKGLISYNGEQSSIIKSDLEGIEICLKKLDKSLYNGNETQYKQRPNYNGAYMGMDRIRVNELLIGSEISYRREYYLKSRIMFSGAVGLALTPKNEDASLVLLEDTEFALPIEYYIGLGAGWQVFRGTGLRLTPQIEVVGYSLFDDPYIAVCPKINVSYPISEKFVIGVTPMMGFVLGYISDFSPYDRNSTFFGISLTLGWQKRMK